MRIENLRTELLTVEDWDGDTQVDINLAIEFFSWLAKAFET